MVEIMRAITTSSVYRPLRARLSSKAPDDVWFEPKLGWLLTFPMIGPNPEQLALFVVAETADGRGLTLHRATEVHRTATGVQILQLWAENEQPAHAED